ncbi:phage major capsid protein [Phaeobacter sp. JH20_30]|uniref:phage major capsid protein n=1 Tax=unclassified Phaeobacter TaxID=2621772 RepID=UPI003A835DDB
MDKILELMASQTEGLDAMEALSALIGSDEWTDEKEAELSALQAADDKIAAEIKILRDIEARKAAAATPMPPLPGVSPAPAATGTGGNPAVPAEKGLTFARMIRTVAAAGGNRYVAQQIAEKNGDSGLFANQNMTDAASGGFLVPEDVSEEVIELLRPASVVTAMGVRTVPMPSGNMTTNRRAKGASFGYGGEQQDVPATGYQYGQMKLSAKKLRGIIPVSNDLLRTASTAVDRMIRDDAVEDAAQIQDRYFLRGPGTDFAPKGMRFQHTGTPFAKSHVLQMTAAPDLQKIDNDLGRMELAMANANIVFTGAHWIMSPRTAMFLTNLRDGSGNKVYPEMASGQLRMKTVHITTEFPDNLGDNGNASEIMLAHPSHIVVGEHMGIEIAMSTEAAYKDAEGKMQAAFSRDETLMRMIMQHDIGLRHLPAVVIMTDVTWGAAP